MVSFSVKVSTSKISVFDLRSGFTDGAMNVVFSVAARYIVGIRKSLYVSTFVREKGSCGVNSTSSEAREGIESSCSLKVRLSVVVPMLVNFRVGVEAVKINPGFTFRIVVSDLFVPSLNIRFFWIVRFCVIVAPAS